MTLGSHQRTIGRSQAHLTPRFILAALGEFDLDPCAADPRPFDCAKVNWTLADDGLARKWFGRPWVNPPFHRHQVGSWIERIAAHARGILLVHARTETAWFNPIWRAASGLLFFAHRVVFLKSNGTPQTISNPKSKHFGKEANSGAPVVLASFGECDLDVLAGCGLAPPEYFVPLRFARGVLVAAIEEKTWRELVAEFLKNHDGPVAVADLYRAFAGHPKTKSNPHYREKLRQTLGRGAGKRVKRDQWVAA